MTINIVKPNTPDYQKACKMVNIAFENLPDAFIFCENTQDVSAAVLLAKKDKKSIRVRSGRHSYLGFSTGGKNTYVIDVSQIKSFSINQKKSNCNNWSWRSII